jgi:amino acid adenylation domain-containing protein
MAEPLHGLLDRAAERAPEKVAITTDEVTTTYAALAADSRRLAAWMVRSGVRRGDRVAVLLPNGVRPVTVAMAASRIGAIFTILDPGLKPYGAVRLLADAAPALVVTESRRLPDTAGWPALAVEDGWDAALATPGTRLPVSPGPTDPACLIYTSGSTSQPKAVVSTHASVRFAADAIQRRLAVAEEDVIGAFLPLSFDYGLYQVFLAFQAGATLAMGEPRHVGPGFLRTLRARLVTGLPAVPTMIALLVRLARRAPDQLPALRFVTSTGAHLPPALIDELRAFLPDCRVFAMYGLTECKRVSILMPEEYAARPRSVGRPLDGTRCAVVGPDGRPLPTGEPGELVVAGPHVMQGYWRCPDRTAARFRPWLDGGQRALFTGDTCSMDGDGFLTFHGRTDDVFKHHERRVSSLEVEAAAGDVPGVMLAALLPPREAPEAVLFVTGERTAADVMTELRDRLEDDKLPDRVVVVDALPLRSNGKIDRARLPGLLREPARP